MTNSYKYYVFVCACVCDALLEIFFSSSFLFFCSFAFISKHVFFACYYTKNFTVLETKNKKNAFEFRKKLIFFCIWERWEWLSIGSFDTKTFVHLNQQTNNMMSLTLNVSTLNHVYKRQQHIVIRYSCFSFQLNELNTTHPSLSNNYFLYSIFYFIRCARIKHTIEYWNKTFFLSVARDLLARIFFSLFAPIDFRIYTYSLLFFELILAGCHVYTVGRSITEHWHITREEEEEEEHTESDVILE